MVPPFLQPHPDLQSAEGNAPLSSKHPTQLPTTDCLLSIIPLMGGQPSDAPALSPPSPLSQGGQPIALALSPSSPPPQDGQPSDSPGLSPSSSTLLLCPSDSTLSICHLNSQSAVKTGSNQPTFFQLKAALTKACKEGVIRQNAQGRWLLNLANLRSRGANKEALPSNSFNRRRRRGKGKGRGRSKGRKKGRRRRRRKGKGKGKGKGRRRRRRGKKGKGKKKGRKRRRRRRKCKGKKCR
ncbi:hypothetical protein ACOMHN_009771 [Nucella lapillus]